MFIVRCFFISAFIQCVYGGCGEINRLSNEEKSIIVSTWSSVKSYGLQKFGQNVIFSFFGSYPNYSQWFPDYKNWKPADLYKNPNIPKDAFMIGSTLDAIVNQMDNHRFQLISKQVGYKIGQYNLSPAMIVDFKNVILHTISKFVKVPKLIALWERVLKIIMRLIVKGIKTYKFQLTHLPH